MLSFCRISPDLLDFFANFTLELLIRRLLIKKLVISHSVKRVTILHCLESYKKRVQGKMGFRNENFGRVSNG